MGVRPLVGGEAPWQLIMALAALSQKSQLAEQHRQQRMAELQYAHQQHSEDIKTQYGLQHQNQVDAYTLQHQNQMELRKLQDDDRSKDRADQDNERMARVQAQIEARNHLAQINGANKAQGTNPNAAFFPAGGVNPGPDVLAGTNPDLDPDKGSWSLVGIQPDPNNKGKPSYLYVKKGSTLDQNSDKYNQSDFDALKQPYNAQNAGRSSAEQPNGGVIPQGVPGSKTMDNSTNNADDNHIKFGANSPALSQINDATKGLVQSDPSSLTNAKLPLSLGDALNYKGPTGPGYNVINTGNGEPSEDNASGNTSAAGMPRMPMTLSPPGQQPPDSNSFDQNINNPALTIKQPQKTQKNASAAPSEADMQQQIAALAANPNERNAQAKVTMLEGVDPPDHSQLDINGPMAQALGGLSKDSSAWPSTVGPTKVGAQQLMQYAVQKLGLNPANAAALIGHAQAESGLNPDAVGDHGNSHGLFQLNQSVGRYTPFVQWAAQNNLDPHDPTTQLQYAKVDAQNQGIWDKFAAAPDLQSASKLWMDQYEKPAIPNYSARIALGQQVMNSYQGGGPSPSDSQASSGPSGNTITVQQDASKSLPNPALAQQATAMPQMPNDATVANLPPDDSEDDDDDTNALNAIRAMYASGKGQPQQPQESAYETENKRRLALQQQVGNA